MAEQINYETFLSTVEQMVAERDTGALFLRTDSNNSVVVGIEDGAIVALTAGPKRGLDALARITAMSSCTLRRVNAAVSFHAGELPPTAAILEQLRGSKEEAPKSDVPTTPAAAAAGAKTAAAIDPAATGKILCELLHDFLGPVAPMICDEVTHRGARLTTREELLSVIESLAGEIDSGSEAQEFRDRARRQLGSILE